MAVFRVEKTGNFTVLSNYHLRDHTLSLKAKGLLSQILSLPDNWDYSLRGLACINKESVDAIRSTVRELERAGYVIRKQGRDSGGRMTAVEYLIYEHPRNMRDAPRGQKPRAGNPTPDNPTPDPPISENPTQINKEEIKKGLTNTESIKKEAVAPDPIDAPAALTEFSGGEIQDTGCEGLSGEALRCRDYAELLRENIEYDTLRQDDSVDIERVDELLALMLETVCTSRRSLRIAGGEYPAELVRSRFLRLHSGHIRYVCECMDENTSRVRNIKGYLLAALFNAPGDDGTLLYGAGEFRFSGYGVGDCFSRILKNPKVCIDKIRQEW